MAHRLILDGDAAVVGDVLFDTPPARAACGIRLGILRDKLSIVSSICSSGLKATGEIHMLGSSRW
jgi:hypothetical protein